MIEKVKNIIRELNPIERRRKLRQEQVKDVHQRETRQREALERSEQYPSDNGELSRKLAEELKAAGFELGSGPLDPWKDRNMI